jgi:2-polyprenyl-6-methoxyphenol hydroxylase-like FAD-dependent oxidoreductase
MRTSRRVVVVGGGIGGLTAALALRADGHDVIVLERRETSEEAGAGISLWPNAMRVLRGLGVGEALEASAMSDGRTSIRTSRGRRLSVADMAEIGRRYAAPLAVVHRSHLLTVLRDAVGERTLRLGVTCTGVVQDDRTACVHLDDGVHEEGDVVVAADGIGSRLREGLTDGATVRSTGLVAWRAVVPVDGVDVDAVAGEAWGRGELFGAAPLTHGRLYWFASSRAPGAADGTEREERDRLAERFAGWHDPIPAIVRSTPPAAIIRTPLRELTALPAWTSGRVALLGDAAHAMLPNFGQGGCQAVEDASALARSLGGGAAAPDALRAYERSRKPRAEDVARQSRRMSALAHLRNPAAATLRNLAMRAAPATAMHRRLDALVDG